MKTVNKTIETKNGKLKISYQIDYGQVKIFEKEVDFYKGYCLRNVTIIFEGVKYELERKSYWNEKKTQVIDEYKIGKSILKNEKQVLEYIYRNK